jgi:hypothetical protein
MSCDADLYNGGRRLGSGIALVAACYLLASVDAAHLDLDISSATTSSPWRYQIVGWNDQYAPSPEHR